MEIDIQQIKNIAHKAGEIILKVYKQSFSIQTKSDKTPVTDADLLSNAHICSQLSTLYPDIPILSEESSQIDFTQRSNWKRYWCIDPLDGTKEFIKKNGEFTVNIALIENNAPVLGVVYAPVLNITYSARKNMGAYLDDEPLPCTKNKNLFVVASKSHSTPETKSFINELKKIDPKLNTVSRGSSLKLCMVAQGTADIYPRIAPTMEWDTAAAHAIVIESGKKVWQYNANVNVNEYFNSSSDRLQELVYNKPQLINPFFVVA